MDCMRKKVTLDKAGRLVLPKALRDELNLSPGDTLDVSVEGEAVTLRPRRPEGRLRKKRGIWVLWTDEPVTTEDTDTVLRRIREERGSFDFEEERP